jgi:hypothetical protein
MGHPNYFRVTRWRERWIFDAEDGFSFPAKAASVIGTGIS